TQCTTFPAQDIRLVALDIADLLDHPGCISVLGIQKTHGDVPTAFIWPTPDHLARYFISRLYQRNTYRDRLADGKGLGHTAPEAALADATAPPTRMLFQESVICTSEAVQTIRSLADAGMLVTQKFDGNIGRMTNESAHAKPEN